MQETVEEVTNIMRNNMGSNTMTSRDIVYNALKKRYDQRDWFVVVYKYDKDYYLSRGNNARTPNDEHYFDGNFYRVYAYGMDAAAISFPTKLNTQKVVFNSATTNQINTYNCNKDNQQSPNDLVQAMHARVDPYCPGINIGAIPKEWCSPCTALIDEWHPTSWEAYKFGPLVGGLLKSCDNKNNGLPSFEYQPFAIFNLPPTRKYTVPEEE